MATPPEIVAIRLGYGLSAHFESPADQAALLESVKQAGPDQHSPTLDDAHRFHLRNVELIQMRKNNAKNAKAETNRFKRKLRTVTVRDFQRRVARAVDARAGFGERLVQFWSDHFTVGNTEPLRRLWDADHVNRAIRPYIGGKFSDMMFAAETHPSMLFYLDQPTSVGPDSLVAKRQRGKRNMGLNENLAREMIELHSLGVGADYTQKDVRELAKLLTGLTYSSKDNINFRPNRAQPGEIVVLGNAYRQSGKPKLGDIRAIIDDLAIHPATAQHIARKLAVHFVSDNPPQSLIDRLADTYSATDGNLGAVNAALTDSPEVWEHFREKARQPFDFIVATMRGLGVTGKEIMALDEKFARQRLRDPLTEMGQMWGKPIGPDGWAEDAADWITPQGLAARMAWAMRIPAAFRKQLPDPRALLQTMLGDTASDALKWAVPKAETAREGVVLVLASSDFNRR